MNFDVPDPKPIPDPSTSWFDENGKPTTVAYIYMKSLDVALRGILKFLRIAYP